MHLDITKGNGISHLGDTMTSRIINPCRPDLLIVRQSTSATVQYYSRDMTSCNNNHNRVGIVFNNMTHATGKEKETIDREEASRPERRKVEKRNRGVLVTTSMRHQ